MNKLFFFTFIIILIQGCVASQAVKAKAETILEGACKELFVNRYQTASERMFGGYAAFALAITDDGAQYCAWATSVQVCGEKLFCKVGPEEIDAYTISQCENIRTQNVGTRHTNRTCKIFAKKDDIIWRDYRVNRKQISQEPIQDIESVTPIQEEDKTIQPTRNKLNVDEAKKQCEDIGFKPKTEEFKNCVVELL